MADWTPQSRAEEILFSMINGEPYNGLPQSRIEELLLELKEVIEQGGGGGTSDYTQLSNLPKINDVTLTGNKTAADLSLVLAEVGKGLSTNDYSNEEKAKVANLLTSIQSILDGSELDSFGDVEVALLDKADISDLGTAAAKDSTNAVTSGSTDLVESGAVKDAIDAAVAAAYHHAGTKTVAQLTHDLLIAANEGNVYNITDSGTTTSDFIEGIGKTIDEGSNVGICKVGDVYMFDLLSGFVDTTNFVQKSQTSGLLKNDGTVNEDIEGDVDTLTEDVDSLESKIDSTTEYPYADVITIEDAIPANVADCSVKIEPIQDLHGYDKPWVGGAGKNKLPLVLADIKAANTDGSWSGNAYTVNGVTFTIQTDNDGNVTSILVNGTSTAESSSILRIDVTLDTNTQYILSGCPSGGSHVTYRFSIWDSNWGNEYDDYGSGLTFSYSASGVSKTNIIVTGGTTVNNLVFYPMIRLATETDDTFAPYTNICPITGHTEASVQRDGKNLLDNNDTGLYQVTEDGSVMRYGYTPILLKAGTYTVSYRKKTAITTYLYITNMTTWEYTEITPSGTTVTIDNDTYIFVRSGFTSKADFDVEFENVQLELGSTATPYEPYAGKTYTISLGDTIYGGTVDFDSGVMTVDREFVEFDGSDDELWGLFDSGKRVGSYYVAATILRTTLPSDLIGILCDQFKEVTSNETYAGNIGISTDGDGRILVADGTKAMTKESWTAYLAENPMQIVYTLESPFTVQLTPQQIQLLKGQNTLTASTGQISVTVNGVSGAIGQVQEQVNTTVEALAELAEKLPTAPTTDGAYVLTLTVVDGTPTYSWESAT